MAIMWALRSAIFVAGIASFSLVTSSSAGGEYCYEDGVANTTIAERISMEFKHFFQTEIRKYDTSSPKDFEERATVALWHKAISRLDIPEKDDDGTNNIFKMKRFLSSVMTEISDAAYPNPKNPEHPNHDWKGRAGAGRRWKRKKNRANHDSLNHMRSAALTVFFVHLVQRHRADVWDRILSARGIQPGSDDEQLYVMNIFVAGYLYYLFRIHEHEWDRNRYNMTHDAREALINQFSPEKISPEFKYSPGLGQISTALFLRRIGQTEYYQPLLGKYLNQMVKALVSVNIVQGEFIDPHHGNPCIVAMAFLHDEHSVEYDLGAVSDEKLAAHFEMGLVSVGHFIDHIRINYSHFTKPVGCESFCIRLMYDKLFGIDKMQRIQETYSFWTYLTQQAGIVSFEPDEKLGDESVFNRMKEPGEIRLEIGKTFYESNPWAGRNPTAIEGIWDHVTRYPPKDEAQKTFQALCKDFNLFFDSFFAEQHVHKYLDEGTASFFTGLFR